MLKKTITYTDYDGNVRTEDYWFHLNKAEIAEMELGVDGGMEKMLTQIVADRDGKRIMEVFKTLILKSLGQKSSDGKRFVKSDEMARDFEQSEAYSELFMELCLNSDAAAAFVNGIVPKLESKASPQIVMSKG